MTRHSFLVATLLAAGSLACTPEPQGVDFAIDFEEARGLEAGDAMVYRGLRIGEVRSVGLLPERGVRVQVTVLDEHRDAVYREARFVIEESELRSQREGARQVTMKDRGETRTPIEPADTLEGSEGAVDDFLASLKEVGKATVEAAERAAEQIGEALDQARESPEARQLREDLDRFTRDAEVLAEEEWDRLRKQRLPALVEEAERLRDQLEEDGRLDEAREFWKDFQRWLEEVASEAAGASS
jgi:ABC-type transporter Mla subunit MlaD